MTSKVAESIRRGLEEALAVARGVGEEGSGRHVEQRATPAHFGEVEIGHLGAVSVSEHSASQ